jgi:hypothetical protein
MSFPGSGSSGDRAHRLMTIRVPEIEFELFHRFTGHRILFHNGEGIPALLSIIANLFSSDLSNCDILLMNSANHDYQHCQNLINAATSSSTPVTNEGCMEEYFRYVKGLPPLLESLFPEGKNSKGNQISFYWKSEAFLAYHEGGFIPISLKLKYEELVANLFRQSSSSIATPSSSFSIQFINLTSSLSHLPSMKHARFAHIGQNSILDDESQPLLLWSSLSTQTVLNAICQKL